MSDERWDPEEPPGRMDPDDFGYPGEADDRPPDPVPGFEHRQAADYPPAESGVEPEGPPETEEPEQEEAGV